MTDFIISDLHVPYQDPEALSVMMKMLKHYKPKNVVMNGDMLDCVSLSRFSKEPQQPEAFKAQLVELCGYITQIQRISKVTYIEGNHEARLGKYINDNAPELAGILDMESLIARYLKKRITYVRTTPGQSMTLWGDNKDLMIGHFNKASKNTCYTAKLLVEQYQTNIVQAHTHRLGEYAITGQRGTLHGWEGGCLCSLNPTYMLLPNWQQGFLVRTEVGDRWNVEIAHIDNGECVFRGKLFTP